MFERRIGVRVKKCGYRVVKKCKKKVCQKTISASNLDKLVDQIETICRRLQHFVGYDKYYCPKVGVLVLRYTGSPDGTLYGALTKF